MLLASYEDFQGDIYTRYPPPPQVYEKRARLFRYFPDPILVVGCGFGGLVQAFRELNRQAWGIESSPYALRNRVIDRVIHGNVLDLSEGEFAARQLGEFQTLITEDVLPCLTDSEALIAARNCQALSPIVIHLVTAQGESEKLNYHATGYWMTLTGQPTLSLEGM